jgi:pimeloyl-ACP methyl ester carboxylesterase
MRRCIALDLLAHGATEIAPDQEVSYDAQAAMIEEFLDALNIKQIDLVANDTATGIAQIFAVIHPDRVRTLTLTDGDTHDNLEPAAFKEFLMMATSGELSMALESMLADKEIFRSDRAMGLAYERADQVADDTIEEYLRPFVSSPQLLHDLVRFGRKTCDNKRTRHVESQLRMLLVPTLIVWGTDDVFFDVNGQIGLRDRFRERGERSRSLEPGYFSQRSVGLSSMKNSEIIGRCLTKIIGRRVLAECPADRRLIRAVW